MTLSTLTVHMELSRYNVWIHINKFGTDRVLDKNICEYALIWSQKEKNKWWMFKIVVLDMEGQYNFRPSPLISSQLAVTASSILWEDEGMWNFMSVEGFLDFMLVLHFWKHFALPFWYHYTFPIFRDLYGPTGSLKLYDWQFLPNELIVVTATATNKYTNKST